jgi:hypothetical protein
MRRQPIMGKDAGQTLGLSLSIGLVAGAFAWAILARPGFDGDIAFAWKGAFLLASGVNPYGITMWHGVELFGGAPLYYPPPTLWALLPLARVSSALAGGIVVALSAAFLAVALSRDARWRLGGFASGSFVLAASLGQWAPLLSVALLVPGLGWLAVLKPSTGLAVFVARPSLRAGCIMAALLALSVILMPSWPQPYLAGVRESIQHVSPVASVWYGPALLLGLIRWRRAEARLLVALACIPHMLFFYDELLLLVAVPTSRRELLFSPRSEHPRRARVACLLSGAASAIPARCAPVRVGIMLSPHARSGAAATERRAHTGLARGADRGCSRAA